MRLHLTASPIAAAALVVLAGASCRSHASQRTDSARAADSVFAAVQQRGEGVMGVDQYTSQHVFEDLPDGGRIVLERDVPNDTAGVGTIQRHMREVAADFRAGNFTKPFQVHAVDVPGTDIMAARREQISYTVADRSLGAEVRMQSGDSAAVAAIHRFLAFQRSDHRAAGHEGMPGHEGMVMDTAKGRKAPPRVP